MKSQFLNGSDLIYTYEILNNSERLFNTYIARPVCWHE